MYLSYAVDNECLKLANKIVRSEEWIKQCEAMNATSPATNSGVPQSSGTEQNNDESDDELDLK